MKKILVWVLVLAVLAGGAYVGWRWWTQQAQPEAPEVVRTGTVIRGALEITVSSSGNVAVGERRDLYFERTGMVSEVLVAENARVKQGQVLARLETTDLEHAVRNAELALEQARLSREMLSKPVEEADLELARLAVQSAAQALETARIGKITAKSDADAVRVQAQRARENRFKDYQLGDPAKADKEYELYENAVEQERIAGINADLIVKQSEDQWQAAYYRYQQAKATLTRLEEGPDETQIRQAELRIEQAELALTQAQRNLDDAVLSAPFSGVIATVEAQAGILAPTGRPAFTLVDDAAFYVNTTVDEIDIGKVVLGQPVDVILDAYPDAALTGKVDRIAPAATNVAGVVSYVLRVQLDPTDAAKVRDGMTASITIRAARLENLLLVPNWAVRTDRADGSTYGYRMVAGAPQRVTITTGRRNETYTEVLSGLEEGDDVALVAEARTLFEDVGNQ
ncbi:MAG: HlyD family secretion protein [Anaerolineae bacterium]|nr:HlyD family secretion protein [Anaerolineae bacterium]